MASKNGLSRPFTTMTSCLSAADAPPAAATNPAAATSVNAFLIPFPSQVWQVRSLRLPASSTRVPDFARIIRRTLVFPGRVDELLEIVFRLPGQVMLGLAVVHPVRVISTWDIDRIEAACPFQIRRDLAVIDRPVHADIVELPLGARIVERGEHGAGKIVDMDEVPPERPTVGVAEKRD